MTIMTDNKVTRTEFFLMTEIENLLSKLIDDLNQNHMAYVFIS